MPEGKRVALYARVSTADQTAENQLLDLRRYCAARGWTPLEPAYVDVGISGAKKDRPALGRLMEDVRKRRLDVVLVWRFDRFARSLSHLVSALQEFNERGISFTSYSENIDTGTSQGKMVFAVMAALAEFERDLITERINAGIRRASVCKICQHGKHRALTCGECGCSVYESRKNLGRPRQISGDQIALIRDLRARKWSLRQIAVKVGFSKTTVADVLSDKYTQNVAMGVDGTQVAV